MAEACAAIRDMIEGRTRGKTAFTHSLTARHLMAARVPPHGQVPAYVATMIKEKWRTRQDSNL